MITIIDYNMGNPGSIRNMLKKLGFESEITSDRERVATADKIILPGVGAFDSGMQSLERSGLIEVLDQRVQRDRVPTLGICLGMQLMCAGSEEGERRGLCWIDARALRFRPADAALKVPNMGWGLVRQVRPAPLVHALSDESRFYFVHSYFIRCNREQDVLLTSVYGELFHSAFHRDNVWGVQFHPEKSHRYGMQLLRNFVERC